MWQLSIMFFGANLRGDITIACDPITFFYSHKGFFMIMMDLC